METRSKRRETEPIVDKIRRGEISVFVAVAEELPEVFRTHVVAKLDLISTLRLAQVNKYYNAAVWSVEAMESMDKKQKVHVAAEPRRSYSITITHRICRYEQHAGAQDAPQYGSGPQSKVPGAGNNSPASRRLCWKP